MQVLTKYFRENKDDKTVGWLTRFLWQYEFKKTVHMIKDPYKKLKQLDSD